MRSQVLQVDGPHPPCCPGRGRQVSLSHNQSALLRLRNNDPPETGIPVLFCKAPHPCPDTVSLLLEIERQFSGEILENNRGTVFHGCLTATSRQHRSNHCR